jgi:hypothetical protein
MNPRLKIFLTGALAFFAGAALVFYLTKNHSAAEKDSEAADSKTASSAEKQSDGATIKMDVETQKRIGLEITNPVATQWQPEIKAFGRVIDPSMLAAAVADLESARALAEISGNESARTKILAAQNNVSARALESAQAAAMRDELSFAATRSKFILDWGAWLAAQTNLETFVQQFSSGEKSLVRLDLSAGENFSAPVSAQLALSTDETNRVDATFLGSIAFVDPQTQNRSYFVLANQMLPPNAAVTAFLKISGARESGVTIPASAILRHEGKGWIYVQTGGDEFTREEISLDKITDGGWFVSENLAATNQIVVTGAQALLSSELVGNQTSGD